MELRFDVDITPEMYQEIEKAYHYYNLDVRDVVEILLKQSYILGDCPFYPKVTDITATFKKEESKVDALNIDWRDPEAVRRFLEEE